MQKAPVSGIVARPSLYKIVYRSYGVQKSRPEQMEADLADILGVSQAWNFANGITGALLLTQTGYAQVLEGPRYAVKALFGHIACDHRHRAVELLYHENHSTRDFGNWAMAIVGAPQQSDIELASTAFQRDIVLDNGAEDILLMLRWLLIEEPLERAHH